MIIRKFTKLYYFILFLLKIKKNNSQNYQEKIFNKVGLNRATGLTILNELKAKHDSLNIGMSSEHQTIFSSISANSNIKISKILEIGTFDGSNAFLLSRLFPSASVLTIDLSKNTKSFQNSYGRNNELELKNFLKKRNDNLKLSKNIYFKEMNSIKLFYEKDNFDLIWIDGAHGYPFVTFDILNSLRLCSKNGIIMCDDIFIKKVKNPDSMYRSNASIETLRELEKEGIIQYKLFLKRLENKFNYFPQEQKFIGFITKL